MKNIIINADDFGRSHSRNIAINMCMRRGFVSQTSLMVNMGELTEEAVAFAENGNYKNRVVLHLNLTLGTPLTERIKHTPVCEDGVFVGMKDVLSTFRRYMTADCRKAIREECEAQILKYIELGFEPFHIDSHNWIHLDIPVWISLRPLLKKYGFKSIRPMRHNLRFPEGKGKRAFLRCIYYRIINAVICLSRYSKNSYSSGLEEFLDADFQGDIAEVFSHPDMQDGEIFDYTGSYKGDPYKKISFLNSKFSNIHNRTTYQEFYKDKQ